MKTTRVGGGHPGYLVRQDPVDGDVERSTRDRRTSRTSGTTRSPAWSTPARCTASTPYYGPFGDIADVVACEDQFRNAYLLGCVGAWSLHPKQIAIAKKVFSPSVEDVAHARRVVEAMGDGTGAVMLDGKMEDDASLKQCLVMVELAEQLAAVDPELKKAYDAIEVEADMSDGDVPRPALGALHAELERARRSRRPRPSPCDAHHLRPRGRRRPRRQAGGPRGARRPRSPAVSTASAS